jgi:retron-type reverse transcriptase
VWIPKPDGRQRPLGIAALEDKIVQQAVLWVLQCIYEQDFLGFSYGFRPHRSQHNALDALSVAITTKKVNRVLDADVEGLFIPPESVFCRRAFNVVPSGSSIQPLPAALTRSTTSG